MTASEILKSVEIYLSDKESETALSITGPWGSGKTYLYKNKIRHLIEDTSYDDEQNYKSIYISLFGISSLQQIQDIIFFESLASSRFTKLGVKPEHIRFGLNILKGMITKFLDEEYLNSSTETIDETGDKIKQSRKLAKYVICFDDIESKRRSRNIKLTDFIGFVNNLVEHQGVKVILLCNEDKIAEEDYNALKEKVIGRSIRFDPILEEIYEDLVAASNPEGISIKKEIILETFRQKNLKNLRILKLTLSNLKHIYKQLGLDFEIDERAQEKLDSLVKFTSVITIECSQEGGISAKDYKDLHRFPPTWFKREMEIIDSNMRLDENEEVSDVQKYHNYFGETYYGKEVYYYFESIIDFITGISNLDIHQLRKELERSFPPYGNKHINLFNKIYKHYNTFSDNNEYENALRELLKYSDQGIFPLNYYSDIFYLLVRFDNPLKIDISILVKRIKEGMEKAALDTEMYVWNMEDRMSKNPSSEYQKVVSKL